jgi:RNA polymerase sigma factor for flagellar operon FliA
MPRLDQQEERALWQAFKEAGCPRSRSSLIEAYLPLVTLTRRKAFGKAPERLWEDLESEGRIALCHAADRFKPDRGVAFQTFAIIRIRCSMHDYLRQDDWMPRSVRDRQKAGEAVPVYELVSLEEIIGSPEEATDLRLLDRLADPQAEDGDRVTVRLARMVVGRLVQSLPKKERKVVHLYYWDDLTFHQIAVRLGISDSRAHQIHSESVRRLAHWLSPWEIGYAGS